MTKFRTRYTPVWLLACVILGLTGCAPGEGASDPAPDRQVKLTVVTGSQISALEEQLYTVFEEAHPHIKVTKKSWNAWPRDYLTSSTPPDLMAIAAGNWLFSTIHDNLVADITDIWEQANLSQSYPLPLQKLTVWGGKQYLLPTGYEWRAIYYNRAIFNEFDLAVPQTWGELLQVAEVLRQNGEVPFSIAGRNEWDAALWFDYLNLRLNGPAFHESVIRGEISFTDDRLRAVFLALHDLFDRGYFIANHRNYSLVQSLLAVVRGDGEARIAREKAVMVLTSSGAVDELPLIFQEELDFFAFPTMDPAVGTGEIIGPFGYIVPANAPNRQAAFQFLIFVSGGEAQELLTLGVGAESSYIPAHLQTVSTSLKAEIRQGFELVRAAQTISLPYIWASPHPMSVALQEAITRFFMGIERDKLDLDEILQHLEEARLTTHAEDKYHR